MSEIILDPLLIKTIRCKKNAKFFKDGFIEFLKNGLYEYSKYNLLGKDMFRVWEVNYYGTNKFIDIKEDTFNVYFKK